ncbi:hypothetical protein B0H16DRAFT_1603689 [Mycena metata]|uniref:Uncharacterized protein n=1 Tax=Mycena metata TaxID=1033252 RepID=A0AAD7MKG1_9AGAR|nr:hypothetical protein B0H16DRAFT_1603689 [Mycena metata]
MFWRAISVSSNQRFSQELHTLGPLAPSFHSKSMRRMAPRMLRFLRRLHSTLHGVSIWLGRIVPIRYFIPASDPDLNSLSSEAYSFCWDIRNHRTLRCTFVTNGLSSYRPNRRVVFPWSQLTVLDIGWIPPFYCADVLTWLVNIIYCHIKLSTHGYVDDKSSAATLHHLETLVLESFVPCRRFAQPSLLDMLTPPSLKRLQVTDDVFPEAHIITTLESLISRSGWTLLELSFCRRCLSRRLYQEFQTAFPSVPSLVLGGRLEVIDPFSRKWDAEDSESNSSTDSDYDSNGDDTSDR